MLKFIRSEPHTFIFGVLVTALIVFGWLQRDEYWVTAERGLGYAFGIIGGSLMLLLLLYPVRKYWKAARRWFPVKYWFQMHMLFGVIGPVLILFHSNFRLGSTNSNIALFCMLMVASSGLVGRYVYTKLHRGLYGEQIEWKEIFDDYRQSREHLGEINVLKEKFGERLKKVESRLTELPVGFLAAWWSRRQICKIRDKSKRALRLRASELKSDKVALKEFTNRAREWYLGLERMERLARYSQYTAAFSLWHLFHMPLFIMMIITAIVHVVVVHLY